MTLGFQECDLIFSVHDRCKELPDDLQFTLNFTVDHGGVSISRDNVTLTPDDFSLTDVRGCHHTSEIRIPYRVEPTEAQDFKWTILKEGETWAEYKVVLRKCVGNTESKKKSN